jgi:hypothetical protein
VFLPNLHDSMKALLSLNGSKMHKSQAMQMQQRSWNLDDVDWSQVGNIEIEMKKDKK